MTAYTAHCIGAGEAFCSHGIVGFYIENLIKSFVCDELGTPAEAVLVEAS